MKLDQKAQHLIEYMLLVAAVVAGALGVVSSDGLMKNSVQNSLNRAVETIYGDYFWKLGVATPCSVLPGCGNGTQTRTVVCSNGSGDVVADGLCAGKGPKPLTTIDCNISCGGYAWWQSGFGACSVACGPGTQSQIVECRDAGGITVADALCGGGKPPDSVPCDNGCFAWVAGMTCTGLCSEPCGVGTCPRSVVCQDTRTSMTVADANCTGPKPGPTIACNTAITCGYQWVVDDWGNCDQACGDGFKHRLVQCRRIADNAVVPDANCGLPPTKPVDQLACNLGPCNHWGIQGNWTTCTKPCGTGDQDANIVCLDKFNNVQPDANCPLAESGPKPASNRPCNTGACTWGTGAYGACSTTCGTGAQTRNIWCYQAGVPAVHFSIAWCGAPPGVPPAAAPSCSDAPANITCTQVQSCSDTSTCCGNGSIEPGEQCDSVPHCTNCTCDSGYYPGVGGYTGCYHHTTCGPDGTCNDGITTHLIQGCAVGSTATWDCGGYDGSTANCSGPNAALCPGCGNGIRESGEACDLGDAFHGNGNGVCPKTCSATCTANSCPSCCSGSVSGACWSNHFPFGGAGCNTNFGVQFNARVLACFGYYPPSTTTVRNAFYAACPTNAYSTFSVSDVGPGYGSCEEDKEPTPNYANYTNIYWNFTVCP